MYLKFKAAVFAIFFSGLNLFASTSEPCNDTNNKTKIVALVLNRIKQQPIPRVISFIEYSSSFLKPETCQITYSAEPHIDRPYCNMAYRNFYYDTKTDIMTESHDYSGWCDY